MADYEALNPMQGVSGPSIFSKRVDLEYKPDAYGEGVQYAADKAGFPLAEAPKSPQLSQAPKVATAQAKPDPITLLYADTQRPDEAITAGIDRGAGPGSESLMMKPAMGEKLSDTLAKMLPYDQTGEINVLYQQALARGM